MKEVFMKGAAAIILVAGLCDQPAIELAMNQGCQQLTTTVIWDTVNP
jgi:hypothetical protein